MTHPALLDTTVLSYFAVVGRADLPLRLYPHAGTTPAALVEYREGVAGGQLPAEAWDVLPVLELTPEESEFAASLPIGIGAGERTCLAVAKYRDGLLATDDLAARSLALRHGVAVTGTVGILLRCVREGMLAVAEANTLLARMIAAGYRSPVTTLDALLP
jgi:predicted nucleic acid-binding protein